MRLLSLNVCGIVLAGIMALAVPCIAGTKNSSTAVKTGIIIGKVVDAHGNPVSGAVVRVMRMPKGANFSPGGSPGGPNGPGPRRPIKVNPGQSVWIKHTLVMGITKTRTNGTFVLNKAPIGRYSVIAMKRCEGFGHVNKPVVVKSGVTAVAGTITLQKGRRGPRGPGGPGGPNGGMRGPGGWGGQGLLVFRAAWIFGRQLDRISQ